MNVKKGESENSLEDFHFCDSIPKLFQKQSCWQAGGPFFKKSVILKW